MAERREAASGAALEAEPMALSDAGSRALAAGRVEEALMWYAAAATSLAPEHDAVAPPIYENLGLAHLNLGQWGAAARAFARALDGAPASRPQSARFLVTCLVNLQQLADAQRALTAYEAAYGEHPDGWTSVNLAAMASAQRTKRARRAV